MRVLGIETSCDETAAAVVKDGVEVLSSSVASQDELHEKFGGVVPEIASRRHITALFPAIERALSIAKMQPADIDGIAVTRGPGLIGSLLVGVAAAKSLAYSLRTPLVGVHHIEGHLASVFLGVSRPRNPFVGLVASGGHTHLYLSPEIGRFELIGQSRDDAAGEAFDKIAKLLGLGYPGGPAIERTATGGDRSAIQLPRPIPKGLDFSFSGLKTAVAYRVQKYGMPKGKDLSDLAASFQEAIADVLVRKAIEATDISHVRQLAVCGGVARNARIRERLAAAAADRGIELFLTPPLYCTDNAAMIAAAGFGRLSRGERDDLDLNAFPTIPLGR